VLACKWRTKRHRKTPKLIRRLPMPRAIMRTIIKACDAKAYELQNCVNGACHGLQSWVGLLHVDRGIPCRPNPAATQLVYTSMMIRKSSSTVFLHSSLCLNWDVSLLQLQRPLLFVDWSSFLVTYPNHLCRCACLVLFITYLAPIIFRLLSYTVWATG